MSKVRFNSTSALPHAKRVFPFLFRPNTKGLHLFITPCFSSVSNTRVTIYFYATVSGSTAASPSLLSILRFPRQVGTNDDN